MFVWSPTEHSASRRYLPNVPAPVLANRPHGLLRLWPSAKTRCGAFDPGTVSMRQAQLAESGLVHDLHVRLWGRP